MPTLPGCCLELERQLGFAKAASLRSAQTGRGWAEGGSRTSKRHSESRNDVEIGVWEGESSGGV